VRTAVVLSSTAVVLLVLILLVLVDLRARTCNDQLNLNLKVVQGRSITLRRFFDSVQKQIEKIYRYRI
jgi:hypothetical protein